YVEPPPPNSRSSASEPSLATEKWQVAAVSRRSVAVAPPVAAFGHPCHYLLY
ncbi:hypothetical protein A2U01_0096800, partial [Trifolium medium]|nr:hypothetical protein [Trifolium medium]